MRGGTSKALMLHRADLPASREDWAPIFLAAIGSPDPYGRQLNGMGGGVTSLSKVCVIGPPSRPDADVDYTFVQVEVNAPVVDYAANCGNMSSAIGPFAVDEGLVKIAASAREAEVRIHNTNTGKIIVSRFAVENGVAAVKGDFALDGVAGTGAPVRLDFLDPGGAKTSGLLPTGHAVDTLELPDGSRVRATLVDATNPCVFLDAADLGLSGIELPPDFELETAALDRLEHIRQAASVKMGVTVDLKTAATIGSVPKIGVVSAPRDAPTLSGRKLGVADADLHVRMLSMGQPHRAVPLTGALCLAAALRVEGSIPQRLARATPAGTPLRIAHPSGVVTVDAGVKKMPDGAMAISHVSTYRTTRRLFEGSVLYPSPD